MPKIAMIGAGGLTFPLRLVGDLLSFEAIRDSTISLMDPNPETLSRTAAAARELVSHHGFSTRLATTTDQREALEDADYIFITFNVGGVEALKHDLQIPLRYGVDQTVGDTLGPGGVFRFLRSANAYRSIVDDMATLCPSAVVINYANPMAMNCWYLSRLGVRAVGLCHSVQNTSRMLASAIGVSYGDVRYVSAGINHQAWFLQFARAREDLYPVLMEHMFGQHLGSSMEEATRDDVGDHSEVSGPSIYHGTYERVRTELMAVSGYFQTESSHHASEYVPYFRKDAARIEAYLPYRWDYYQNCLSRDGDQKTSALLTRLKERLEPSLEYGAQIVNGIETGEAVVIYGNVENRGLISNLPEGCCVEVPCLVDANGVQPTAIGALPPQCAAINRNSINLQELAVEAAVTGDVDHVYHAVMLDPLTSAVLSLGQIESMVGEMLEVHAKFLPQFQRGRSAVGSGPVGLIE